MNQILAHLKLEMNNSSSRLFINQGARINILATYMSAGILTYSGDRPTIDSMLNKCDPLWKISSRNFYLSLENTIG